MSGVAPSLLAVTEFAVQRGAWRVALPRLTLGEGEVAALFGPSGCGKTTVLEALLGVIAEPEVQRSGDTHFAGSRWPEAGSPAARALLRADVLYLPQNAFAALDPLVRVGEQVATWGNGDAAAVRGAFARLGLAGLETRYPHELSGGEAQRVLLALALVRRPRLLVADEPTAHLDRGTRATAVAVVRELAAQGAVLLATHERSLAPELAARTLLPHEGAFVSGLPPAAKWPGTAPVHPDAEPVLAARGVVVRRGARTILAGVDLEVRRGEWVALLGPSGAGKSTLARVLAGLEVPTSGTVVRPARRSAVQILFQEARASLTPRRRISALVAEVARAGFAGGPVAAELGLDAATLARSRETISGGEARRVALLRALAAEPEVLILDEPTASLDAAAAHDLVATISGLQARHGVSILMITHDEDLARSVAHRVVRLEGGSTCND